MEDTKKNRPRKKLALSTSLVVLNAVIFLLLAIHYIAFFSIIASEWTFTAYETKYFVGIMILYAFKLLTGQTVITLISFAIYYLSAIAGHIGEKNRLLEQHDYFDYLQ